MSWVRKAPPASGQHDCEPPVIVESFKISPAGTRGDLWRCDTCRMLWRIGLTCDACDRNKVWGPHGMHAVGTTWRPATLWQCIRHHREGNP